MGFNGTKHFPKQELVDYLESIGTKFGPDLNAYTSFDETYLCTPGYLKVLIRGSSKFSKLLFSKFTFHQLLFNTK